MFADLACGEGVVFEEGGVDSEFIFSQTEFLEGFAGSLRDGHGLEWRSLSVKRLSVSAGRIREICI